jgi:hypothetical protein
MRPALAAGPNALDASLGVRKAMGTSLGVAPRQGGAHGGEEVEQPRRATFRMCATNYRKSPRCGEGEGSLPMDFGLVRRRRLFQQTLVFAS